MTFVIKLIGLLVIPYVTSFGSSLENFGTTTTKNWECTSISLMIKFFVYNPSFRMFIWYSVYVWSDSVIRWRQQKLGFAIDLPHLLIQATVVLALNPQLTPALILHFHPSGLNAKWGVLNVCKLILRNPPFVVWFSALGNVSPGSWRKCIITSKMIFNLPFSCFWRVWHAVHIWGSEWSLCFLHHDQVVHLHPSKAYFIHGQVVGKSFCHWIWSRIDYQTMVFFCCWLN